MPSYRSYIRRIDMPTSCTTCPVNFFETSVFARSAHVRRCLSYPIRRRGRRGGDAGRDIRRVFPRDTARGTKKVAGSNPPGAPRRAPHNQHHEASEHQGDRKGPIGQPAKHQRGPKEARRAQLDPLRGTRETPIKAGLRKLLESVGFALANYWSHPVVGI